MTQIDLPRPWKWFSCLHIGPPSSYKWSWSKAIPIRVLWFPQFFKNRILLQSIHISYCIFAQKTALTTVCLCMEVFAQPTLAKVVNVQKRWNYSWNIVVVLLNFPTIYCAFLIVEKTTAICTYKCVSHARLNFYISSGAFTWIEIEQQNQIFLHISRLCNFCVLVWKVCCCKSHFINHHASSICVQ